MKMRRPQQPKQSFSFLVLVLLLSIRRLRERGTRAVNFSPIRFGWILHCGFGLVGHRSRTDRDDLDAQLGEAFQDVGWRAFVRDEGVGFDVEATAGFGLGLTSMRERLKLVGGELFIESHSSRGTTIRARAPIQAGGGRSAAS